MARKPYPLFTIGYEGTTLDNFVRTLVAHNVKVLIDVRAVPLSRKPGFSKNKLAGRLAQDDITYIGLKGLGTPPDGRAAARKGQKSELERIFGAHLRTMEAVRDLQEAVKIAQSNRACLLCYEHSPRCCHRLLVAEAMGEVYPQEIIHLNPTDLSLDMP